MISDIQTATDSPDPLSQLEAKLKPLWIAANHGDDAAYRSALELMAHALRRSFSGRLRGRTAEAEELVQEVLLSIHVKRGSYNPAFPVTAWMYGIARHKYADFFRSQGLGDSLTDRLEDGDDLQIASEESTDDTLRDLQTLLNQLPENQRTAITLAKLEGLSLEEVSDRTGASVAAVKVQIHRGLTKLAAIVRKTR